MIATFYGVLWWAVASAIIGVVGAFLQALREGTGTDTFLKWAAVLALVVFLIGGAVFTLAQLPGVWEGLSVSLGAAG